MNIETPCVRSQAEAPPPQRVLVVEDNDDSAALLVEILERRGMEVRAATSAADAMDALRDSLPDIVILDIGLPDADGYHVARTIRKLFGSAIRLIALTGFSSAAEFEDAMAAGFNSFLTKPYLIEELEVLLTRDPRASQFP